MIRLLWFVLSAAAAILLAGPAFHVLGPVLEAGLGAPIPANPVVRAAGLIACGAVILTGVGFAITAVVEGVQVGAAHRRLIRSLDDAEPDTLLTATGFREMFTAPPFLADIAERAAVHLIPVRHAVTGLRAHGEIQQDTVQAALPAVQHFGAREIADGRLLPWLYRPLPQALWGGSVLAAALAFTHAGAGPLSWATLVATAAWGFALPAAAGVIVHLLIRLILGWRRAQADRLCKALDTALHYSPPNRQLHALLATAREQTHSLETAIASLGVAFEQTAVADARARASSIESAGRSLGTSLKADLEAALKEPLAQLTYATVQLSEDQSAQVQQVLRTTLKAFVGEVQGLVGQQIRDVHGLLKETTDIAQKLERSLTDSTRTLSKFSKTQSTEMSEALDRYRAALTAFEEKSRRDFGADVKLVIDKLNRSATAFEAATAGADALGAALSPLLSDLLANQQALLAAIERLGAGGVFQPSPVPHAAAAAPTALSEDFRKLRSLAGGNDLPAL